MAPHRHNYDAANRRYVALRIYGDLAVMIDARADAEGKARTTLVDELIRRAWHLPTPEPQPIEPEHNFDRAQPAHPTSTNTPTPQATRARARVYTPTDYR